VLAATPPGQPVTISVLPSTGDGAGSGRGYGAAALAMLGAAGLLLMAGKAARARRR
jgi:hypothetical protein